MEIVEDIGIILLFLLEGEVLVNFKDWFGDYVLCGI